MGEASRPVVMSSSAVVSSSVIENGVSETDSVMPVSAGARTWVSVHRESVPSVHATARCPSGWPWGISS